MFEMVQGTYQHSEAVRVGQRTSSASESDKAYPNITNRLPRLKVVKRQLNMLSPSTVVRT
jgi:hypothetical protein